MLNAVIMTALAAGSPTYADCLLGNIQPGCPTLRYN